MNSEDKNSSSERPVPEIPQNDTEHTHEPEKSENIKFMLRNGNSFLSEHEYLREYSKKTLFIRNYFFKQ